MEMEMTAAKETRKTSYLGVGLSALFRKELADHIRSRRFLIIVALIAVTGVASLYSAVNGMQAAATAADAAGVTQSVFLKLFTTSGTGMSFVSFISLLGPLVGLTLGFDAINGERSRGTLNRLVSQPIYRDAIINGKFLAGIVLIVVMVLSLGLTVSGAGLILTGVPPTGEEAARVAVFLLFTIVYMSFWLGLSILFSILCRHAATSALAVIAIWLVCAVFIGLLASFVANALYPVTDSSAMDAAVGNYTTMQGINRISPSDLYGESVTTILDPSVRATGLITSEAASGLLVDGMLPLGESVILVWPMLAGLVAMTMICFLASYMIFMRQEIRAN